MLGIGGAVDRDRAFDTTTDRSRVESRLGVRAERFAELVQLLEIGAPGRIADGKKSAVASAHADCDGSPTRPFAIFQKRVFKRGLPKPAALGGGGNAEQFLEEVARALRRRCCCRALPALSVVAGDQRLSRAASAPLLQGGQIGLHLRDLGVHPAALGRRWFAEKEKLLTIAAERMRMSGGAADLGLLLCGCGPEFFCAGVVSGASNLRLEVVAIGALR